MLSTPNQCEDKQLNVAWTMSAGINLIEKRLLRMKLLTLEWGHGQQASGMEPIYPMKIMSRQRRRSTATKHKW